MWERDAWPSQQDGLIDQEETKVHEVIVPPAPTVVGRRECLEELLLGDMDELDRHPWKTLGYRWLSDVSLLLAVMPTHRAHLWFRYVIGRLNRHPFLAGSGVDRLLARWVEWQLNQREFPQRGGG